MREIPDISRDEDAALDSVWDRLTSPVSPEVARFAAKYFRPLSLSADSWVEYSGPLDGTGWKNSQTGEVRYQDDRPKVDSKRVPAHNAKLPPKRKGSHDDNTGSPRAARSRVERINSPPVREDGRIELKHWSGREGLSSIDPSSHGTGIAGAESKRKRNDPANWVDRTYYGIGVGSPGGYEKEHGLGDHEYTASIDPDKLYDFVNDPDGLKPPADYKDGTWTSKYEKNIADAGFDGYWVSSPQMGVVAAVFAEMTPEKPKKQGVTSTPKFKAWFGDSKVVDSDGSPLVMYHGSSYADIEEFKGSSRNPMIFTSPASEIAEIYGDNIYPLYVKMSNPRFVEGRDGRGSDLYSDINNSSEKPYDGTISYHQTGPDYTKEQAEKDGRFVDAKGRAWFEVAVESREQLKSASGNNGDFSDDPSIRMNLTPGDKKVENGTEYTLNDNHRWARSDKDNPALKVGEHDDHRDLIENRRAVVKAMMGFFPGTVSYASGTTTLEVDPSALGEEVGESLSKAILENKLTGRRTRSGHLLISPDRASELYAILSTFQKPEQKALVDESNGKSVASVRDQYLLGFAHLENPLVIDDEDEDLNYHREQIVEIAGDNGILDWKEAVDEWWKYTVMGTDIDGIQIKGEDGVTRQVPHDSPKFYDVLGPPYDIIADHGIERPLILGKSEDGYMDADAMLRDSITEYAASDNYVEWDDVSMQDVREWVASQSYWDADQKKYVNYDGVVLKNDYGNTQYLAFGGEFEDYLQSQYDLPAKSSVRDLDDAIRRRDFAFNDWFPNGEERIRLPFFTNEDGSEVDGDDQDVFDSIEEFKGGGKFPGSEDGYEVIDYQKGIAAPKGKRDKNGNPIPVKIGKILRAIKVGRVEEITKQFENGEISERKHAYLIKNSVKAHDDVIKAFEMSTVRSGKGKSKEYHVVLSRNPDDIANMSTGREWTSCMNLQGGSNSDKVYSEVMDGGFIAYVTDPDDEHIERPKARILVRRLDPRGGEGGVPIAIPESVYGWDVNGFEERVQKWVDKKQGIITPGFYDLSGSGSVDALSDVEAVAPKDKKGLWEWMHSGTTKKSAAAFTELVTMDAEKKFDKKEAAMMHTYIATLPKYQRDRAKTFYENHPDFVPTEEILAGSPRDIERMYAVVSPERQAVIRKTVLDDFMSDPRYAVKGDITRNMFNKHASHDKASYYDVLSATQDMNNKLQIFKPLPPNVSKHLTQFGKRLISERPYANMFGKALIDPVRGRELEELDSRVINNIAHTLYMTNTVDDNTVDFVRDYVKSKDGRFDFDGRGGYTPWFSLVGRLGERGKEFVPQMKKELGEVVTKSVALDQGEMRRVNRLEIHGSQAEREYKALQLQAEQYRFVIDSIQTGKRSEKFHPWALALRLGLDVPKRMAAEDWTQFTGKRGGKGWKNAKTGDVEYQDERPGSRGDGKEDPKQSPKSNRISATRGKMYPAVVTGTGESKTIMVNGKPAPKRIQAIAHKIMPGWTDVQVSASPRSELLVEAKDAKGRTQSVYKDSYTMRTASAKYTRVANLIGDLDNIAASNLKNIEQDDNPGVRDTALCLQLIMATGMRPGSARNTRADVQAYGAVTLRAGHVKIDENGVRLQFTGKKGVSRDVPINDPKLIEMLTQRSQSRKADERLFSTNAKALVRYTKKLNNGGYTPKDFRTALGTMMAAKIVNSTDIGNSDGEYRKAVLDVAKKVASQLGNLPKAALQSYINPTVFAKWRPSE